MNKSKITIRPAEKDDYKFVNALYLKSYNNDSKAMPDTYNKMPELIISCDEFFDIIDDNSWDIFVAEISGKIIGIVCLSIEVSKGDIFTQPYKRVVIEELYFDNRYTNHGVGAMLLGYVEKWAKEKGVGNITAMTYAYNKKNYKLFEKCGFAPFSIRMNKTVKP